MNQPAELRLLVIEDNPGDLVLLKEMLSASQLTIHEVYEAPGLKEAVSVLSATKVDVVLLDFSLTDSDGIGSYYAIREIDPKVPVIILTGLSHVPTGLQAIHDGVQDYLIKGEITSLILEKSIRYSIERMQYGEQLRLSEQNYRMLFEKNPFPSLIVDPETFFILEVNEAAIDIYGYSREEFVKLTIAAIRLSDDPLMLINAVWEKYGEAVLERFVSYRKANGEVIVVDAAYFSVDFMNRPAIQIQINDITEKLMLEKQLESERTDKRREVSAAVLEAQEKERSEIGQELHDNVNQIITASRLYMDMVLSGNGEISLLSNAIELASRAIEENRKLSRALILPQLKGEGLVASLEDLRLEFMQTSSLNIKFSMQGVAEDDFTSSEKVYLYRIVQEQLSNIIKYAEAKSVLIRLYKKNDTIILYIKDNGKGFDPAKRSKGVGLISMANRAEVLKGKLFIESAPGKGCTLKIVMQRA